MAAPVDNVDQVFNECLHNYNTQFNSQIKVLKELQLRALQILKSGKDCICSLPTGYGKSLVYELLPFIDKGCLVVVIVPLNAIMEQQLNKLGTQAVSLCPSKLDLKCLKSGKFSFLYSHPEQILTNKTVHDILCSETFVNRNMYLVINEAHCILEWGEEFRTDYKKLYRLRSIFQCQVLALSATLTDEGRKKIACDLLMKKYDSVLSSPAKENIVLIVERHPSPTSKGNDATTPYTHVFQPILTRLNEDLGDFGITIIYCKSMQWLGFGYEMAKRVLGENFYAGDTLPNNARVVMYHSSMEKESGRLKTFILTSLQKPDHECHIRLIFASVALGMGADLTNVKRIVHTGPPSCLETYIQEIGRAGRSGCMPEALMYYNNNDIANTTMRKDMNMYCQNEDKCRREVINEHFGFKGDKKLENCCNHCNAHLGLNWDFSKLTMK